MNAKEAVVLKLIIAEKAEADLVEIADYYNSLDKTEMSKNFLRNADVAFEKLLRMPGIGSPRDYGMRGLRVFQVPKFKKYLIFYVSTKTELHILNVIHGARDLTRILSQPQE